MAVSNITLFNSIANAVNGSTGSRIPKLDAENYQTQIQAFFSNEMTEARNAWINGFIDRIGLSLARDFRIENRLSWAYMDEMTFGKYIQEFGTQPAKAVDSVLPQEGQSCDPFTVNKADTIVLYYQLNEKRKYRVTVHMEELRKAFLNEGGLQSLISQQVASLEKGAALDRYNLTKETFNTVINNDGTIMKRQLKDTQKANVPGVDTEANARATITTIATAASDMTFPRDIYNEAGMMQMTNPDDLVLFVRPEVIQYIAKNVTAYAFNPQNLTFSPSGMDGNIKIVQLDDFGGVYPVDSGGAKLYPIYNADGSTTGKYTKNKGTTSETAVDHWEDPNKDVLAVLMDKRRLMVVNNLYRMDSIWNPSCLYTNWFLHDWNMFVQSAMLNCLVFTKAGA